MAKKKKGSTNQMLREKLAYATSQIDNLQEQVSNLSPDGVDAKVLEILTPAAKRTIILLDAQRKYRDQCFTFARDLYPDDDEKAQDCYEQLAGVFSSSKLEDRLIDSISIGAAI